MNSAFTQYRRKQIAELRPYVEGEDLTGVNVGPEDTKAGSPKVGDMIARNPANHADQWLVSAAYFAANFEPATAEAASRPTVMHMTFKLGPDRVRRLDIPMNRILTDADFIDLQAQVQALLDSESFSSFFAALAEAGSPLTAAELQAKLKEKWARVLERDADAIEKAKAAT